MFFKHKAAFLTGLISVALAMLAAELCLRWLGYGHPVLYSYDANVGYVMKPGQTVVRSGRCRILINNLGMRCDKDVDSKRSDVFRVLVLGDSVPYGGSYIDQDDVFCSVAQRTLDQEGRKFEVLNAGVNAYGPQNVDRYVQSRGLADADLVIVYFPLGDLRRDFTNFYIVPFWSDDPGLALGEFFRHIAWRSFGILSQRWKNTNAFQNDQVLVMNLDALADIKRICDMRNTPVFFLWSPYLDNLTNKSPNQFAADMEALEKRIPKGCIVHTEPVFRNQANVGSLFVDGVHYSSEGHHAVGKYLAEFILSHIAN